MFRLKRPEQALRRTMQVRLAGACLADLRVKIAGRSFYQTFKVTPGQTGGRLIYEMGQKLIGGGMRVAKTLPGLRQQLVICR